MVLPRISQPITFSGRTFSVEELRLAQEITTEFSGLGLNELSHTICELLEWKRPSGRLKGHECRLFLQHLAEGGLVCLPRLRPSGPRGPRRVVLTESSLPQGEIRGSAGEFEPLVLQVVESAADSALWTEYIERYHYLGYRVPVGAQLRYLVYCARAREQILACLLWSSPAWKMAARDRWIGWTEAQRRKNLQYVVNNSRFLILPWIRVRGLASKILSHCARQLPREWQEHYGYGPLLLETLVDSSRFRGTCYRAANWIALGRTQGRGRMDRQHRAHGKAPKEIYVYPLCRQLQSRLGQAQERR